MASEIDPHSHNSMLRERIVEHVFIGDVLRRLWQCRVTDVEVLRSEFDAGGYDLVLSFRKIVRHIQFKTVKVGGNADHVKVSLKLLEKPSGCVILIIVDPYLNLDSFLWFGGPPGKPLPDIRQMNVVRHAKGNAKGTKAERPNHRIVKRSLFEKLSFDQLLERLFGDFAS